MVQALSCRLRSFPALGFDPTPGNAGTVQQVMTSLLNAQVQLGECASRMTDALDVSDDWDGDAADAFHDYGDDLPKAFNSGSTSMANAAKALSTWYGQLTANQQRTEVLEKEAELAKKAAAHAHQEEAAAARHAASAGPHQQAAANGRWADATLAASAADLAYQQVINKAKLLQSKHLQQANTAAEGVRSGQDDSFQPEDDGWFVQLVDGVASTTDVVATVSGTVAAASLVVPGVGEVVAPVAGTVAAGAAGVHTIAALGQKAVGSKNAGSWVDIGVGAVPVRSVTAPASALAKAAFKRGEKQALSTVLRDAGKAGRDGLADSDFAKVVKGLRGRNDPIAKQLADKGRKLGDVINKLPGKDTVSASQHELLGRIRSGHEAAAGLVDSADKLHSTLNPGDQPSEGHKRAMNGLKTALNPSTDSLLNWGKSEATDAAKNALGK